MRGKIDWYPNVEHPYWFRRRALMDARATAIRLYETHFMPGLLQTGDYSSSPVLHARCGP
ncbi:Scr1 family TA system antitoxin-like transcriptional regulator [Streptomyces sp. MUM 203J]|uniref:Scr1 family TA system antitoxin-like transcriptional regulator n=1 Tax=Streptomyces sp. MUM 203J TaxID=2791990 RepID=UPI0035AC2092